MPQEEQDKIKGALEELKKEIESPHATKDSLTQKMQQLSTVAAVLAQAGANKASGVIADASSD